MTDQQKAIHALVREIEVLRGPRLAKPITKHLLAAIAALEPKKEKRK